MEIKQKLQHEKYTRFLYSYCTSNSVGSRYTPVIEFHSMDWAYNPLKLSLSVLSHLKLDFPSQPHGISPDLIGWTTALGSPNPVPMLTTTHVAFVRANGMAKLYINGIKVSSCYTVVCALTLTFDYCHILPFMPK